MTKHVYKQMAVDEVSKLTNLLTFGTLSKKKKTNSTNLAIFDFDDTIFPTSSLYSKLDTISTTNLDNVKLLDTIYFKLIIDLIKKNYRIYIVSNGSESWIMHAMQNMNMLQSLTLLKMVNVVSCCDMFSEKSADSSVWKMLGFFHVINNIRNDGISINTLVSVGDSDHDIYSAWIFHNSMVVNTIKFKAKSTPTSMCKQTLQMKNVLNKNITRERHIDFNRKKKQKAIHQ